MATRSCASSAGMRAAVVSSWARARAVSNSVPAPASRRACTRSSVRCWLSRLARATRSCSWVPRNSTNVRATSPATATCSARRSAVLASAPARPASIERRTRPNRSSSHAAEMPALHCSPSRCSRDSPGAWSALLRTSAASPCAVTVGSTSRRALRSSALARSMRESAMRRSWLACRASSTSCASCASPRPSRKASSNAAGVWALADASAGVSPVGVAAAPKRSGTAMCGRTWSGPTAHAPSSAAASAVIARRLTMAATPPGRRSRRSGRRRRSAPGARWCGRRRARRARRVVPRRRGSSRFSRTPDGWC